MVDGDGEDGLREAAELELSALRDQFAGSDDGLALTIEPADADQAADDDTTRRALDLLATLPTGVIAMSPAVPGTVETSTSLNVATTEDGVLTLACMTRSASSPALEDVVASIGAAARLAGAEVEIKRSYPPWRPDVDSRLLATARATFERLFDEAPRLDVVHGGLECSVIGGKLPGVQMLSLGPEIVGPHAPGERLSVPATQRFYKLLGALLDDLSDVSTWEWDETLYAGVAPYYSRGRMPYPTELADALRDELALDGTGRLLDVGCGPGSLTLLLAPLFAEAVGVDADAGMLAEAEREAARRAVANAVWVNLRAEQLPAGLGTFRVATFAQSFHWMDRERVVEAVRGMLEPGGAWVHVNATTHEGVGGSEGLPSPQPPRDAIRKLVRTYLGDDRRAGAGSLPKGPPSGEEDVLRAAGFPTPRRVDVGGGRVFERSEDDVVASVFTLSSAAPHLFGDRLAEFEADLRELLRATSPDGRFAERQREIELVIWRR